MKPALFVMATITVCLLIMLVVAVTCLNTFFSKLIASLPGELWWDVSKVLMQAYFLSVAIIIALIAALIVSVVIAYIFMSSQEVK